MQLIEEAEAKRQERLAACDRLHRLQKLYRDLNAQLTRDMSSAESELFCDFLCDLIDEIREADARYCQLAGLEVG